MEQVLFVLVAAGFGAFACLFVVCFILSKHSVQTANWVYSVFLLRTAILPSVLGFCVKYTDNCETDPLFSGGEAQLWAVWEPSWLGLPCRYVIVCIQLCMCVAVTRTVLIWGKICWCNCFPKEPKELLLSAIKQFLNFTEYFSCDLTLVR